MKISEVRSRSDKQWILAVGSEWPVIVCYEKLGPDCGRKKTHSNQLQGGVLVTGT